MKNLTTQYITDLMKPVAETHNRTQRLSVNGALAVPRSRSSLFDRSYSYAAPNCGIRFRFQFAMHHLYSVL